MERAESSLVDIVNKAYKDRLFEKPNLSSATKLVFNRIKKKTKLLGSMKSVISTSIYIHLIIVESIGDKNNEIDEINRSLYL